MSESSWKQMVAEKILEIIKQQKHAVFSLEYLYEEIDFFANTFPHNKHVREKIRQTVQKLRDDGFLRFLGKGIYELNEKYPELETELCQEEKEGIEIPSIKQAVRNIRLRNSFIAIDLKLKYRNICQVCQCPVVLKKDLNYSEAHHLQPIGYPHFGPDIIKNIIVLCPNHHAVFDRGCAAIQPDTLHIEHLVSNVIPQNTILHIEPWHKISKKYLEYHYFNIFRKEL